MHAAGIRGTGLLARLDAADQPRHIEAQLLHGSQALLVPHRLFRRVTVDLVPVIGRDNGHARVSEILVKLDQSTAPV